MLQRSMSVGVHTHPQAQLCMGAICHNQFLKLKNIINSETGRSLRSKGGKIAKIIVLL